MAVWVKKSFSIYESPSRVEEKPKNYEGTTTKTPPVKKGLPPLLQLGWPKGIH
jgi:hypothetical protein